MQEAQEQGVSEQMIVIRRRLKARFANLPADRSLVDELIMERRAAAKLELNLAMNIQVIR
jgi:hypothetical protein